MNMLGSPERYKHIRCSVTYIQIYIRILLFILLYDTTAWSCLPKTDIRKQTQQLLEDDGFITVYEGKLLIICKWIGGCG